MINKQVTYFSVCMTVLCLLLAFHAVQDCRAQESNQDTEGMATENADPSNVKAEPFQYQLEDRPDPFVPFIEPKVATKIDMDEIVDPETQLSGMQLFEPGQLTLVALMFSNGSRVAMVEDVTGKGYVIHEGILIGRHGVVSQINEEQVIITETARTRAGKEIVTTVVMRLNKEGDQ